MPKESEIIANIRRNARLVEGVVVGIGDDAAVIKHPGATDLLACCDMSVERVHFRLEWATPKRIGRKALAVTLSDIAAMGGTARFAMVSLALPPASEETLAEKIMQGIFEIAERSGVAIIGGDTSSSTDSLFIDTSVIGECASGKAVTRGGARIGDLIFVTGSLGASALGLALLEQGYRLNDGVEENPADQRVENSLGGKDAEACATDGSVSRMRQQAINKHLVPEPRLRFGKALGEQGLATAMIDVSDGLSTDLSHLLEESHCGAQIQAELLPIADCAEKLSQGLANLNPLQIALHSGEEYELLFTAQSDNQKAIFALADSLKLSVTRIGQIKRGRELFIEREGKVALLLPAGYEHRI
jgi:thiamine-monophosphate kinase